MSRLFQRLGPADAPPTRRRSPRPRRPADEAGETQARALGHTPRRNCGVLSAIECVHVFHCNWSPIGTGSRPP